MKPVERVRIRTVEDGLDAERDDTVAAEEPLAIRIRTEGEGTGFLFVTTMRTPGNDEELAAGLLFAEGAVASPDEIVSLSRADDRAIGRERRENVVVATLAPAAAERAGKLRRTAVMSSACGVCGRDSIDAAVPADRPRIGGSLRVSPELLHALPARLRERQSIFASTGGLHAAGLFSGDGTLRELREDIGRHNATDKLVGVFLLRGEVPLSDSILMVSGRAGFEIVQKACAAGIPVVASVSAPSSLAVSLAEAAGVTLLGFLRNRRFNVYANPERVLRRD
jgi:FdhD protein